MAQRNAASSANATAGNADSAVRVYTSGLPEVQHVHWPLQSPGSFYVVEKREVAAKGIVVKMHRVRETARRILQRDDVPCVAFADEAHAQRVCRRHDPVAVNCP